MHVLSFMTLFLHAVLHPLQVARNERIGKSAVLDLLHERRARIIASDDLDAGLLCEGGIDAGAMSAFDPFAQN
jgi:hypothetical protein